MSELIGGHEGRKNILPFSVANGTDRVIQEGAPSQRRQVLHSPLRTAVLQNVSGGVGENNANNQDVLLFGQEKGIAGGVHNVDGLFLNSGSSFREDIASQYGQRIGHIPTARRMRAIVPQVTSDVAGHMQYLSRLQGREIVPQTFQEFREEVSTLRKNGILPHEEEVFVAAYANTPEIAQAIRENNAVPWGISEFWVADLKNKATFHKLLGEGKYFNVPDYRIVTSETMVGKSLSFLHTIESNYKKTGMSEKYPLGLMMRLDHGDGGMGGYAAYQLGDGRVKIMPDSKEDKAKICNSWEEALEASRNGLMKNVIEGKIPEVVVSRLIDVRRSPGISLVLKKGTVYPLGINDQVQIHGKACSGVGTVMNDLPISPGELEMMVTEKLQNFLLNTYGKERFALADGIINLDLMFPGDVEIAYVREMSLEPVDFYVAEANPRFTNTSDAMLLGLGIDRIDQTIGNMRRKLSQGLLTIDKYDLKGVPPEIARTELEELDRRLKESGEGRVVMRMTHSPAGLALYANQPEDIQGVKMRVDDTIYKLKDQFA